jgi:hypothetical protein
VRELTALRWAEASRVWAEAVRRLLALRWMEASRVRPEAVRLPLGGQYRCSLHREMF